MKVKVTQDSKFNHFVLALAVCCSLALCFQVPMKAVAQSSPITVQDADAFVQDLLQRTEVLEIRNYCRQQPFECRSIRFLKDKKTGQPVPEFLLNFTAPARQVGTFEVFSPVQAPSTSGTSMFNVFIDKSIDGKINIDTVKEPLIVHVDTNRNITLPNVRLERLGTDEFFLGSQTFTESENRLAGQWFKGQDPNPTSTMEVVFDRLK